MQEQPPKQRIKAPFHSLREWGDWMNAHAGPPRADDTPVLAGQIGSRTRATREQVLAVVEEQNGGLGNPR